MVLTPSTEIYEYHITPVTWCSNHLDRMQDNLRVSLLPNPSHLEATSPVVVGKARARLQQLLGNHSYERVSSHLQPANNSLIG